MTNTLVTSLTRKNYEEYGKDFFSSFRLHWPKSVKLIAYYEGDGAFPEQDTENVEWRPVSEIHGFDEWMEAVAKFPYMCGQTPQGYDIQHDARHVRKALTEMHGCNVFGGKVWWIDSDFFTHGDVPEGWLDEVLPDDKFCAYCGREGWMYSETGMIGFNSEHPMYKTFMRAYWEIFWSGLFLTLKGWHDCYGFDAVRHAIDAQEHFVDLSADIPRTMHPIINSVLGTYLDHKKGPRKATRSAVTELVVERDEPYWRM